MKMEFDMTKVVEEMAMQAKETQEEFIFETIRPYCENILQIKINKEELKQILLNGTPIPHGKWLDKKMTIKSSHGLAYGRYGCSVCKKKQPNKTNFCPNCGADMRGESE